MGSVLRYLRNVACNIWRYWLRPLGCWFGWHDWVHTERRVFHGAAPANFVRMQDHCHYCRLIRPGSWRQIPRPWTDSPRW